MGKIRGAGKIPLFGLFDVLLAGGFCLFCVVAFRGALDFSIFWPHKNPKIFFIFKVDHFEPLTVIAIVGHRHVPGICEIWERPGEVFTVETE